MNNSKDQEFKQRIGRIDGLVQEIEGCSDPAAQAAARELVQALLELHAAGLERMLDIAFESAAAGQAVIDELARDELVGSLLLLHGLHPQGLAARVEQALDKVRPSLASHGGDVELLGVSEEGAVRLRLIGSCHGCPSSQATLKYSVEDAVRTAAPDVTAIEVEGALATQAAAPAGFVPMASLLGGNSFANSNGNAANGSVHPNG